MHRKHLLRAGAGFLLLLCVPLLAAGCSNPDRPDRPISNGDDSPAAGPENATGVAGRVSDPRGKPLAGVSVRPQSLDQPANPIPEMAVISEDNGHYTWALKPGKYEISFSADGYQPAARRVTVHPGRTTALDIALDIALKPAP